MGGGHHALAVDLDDAVTHSDPAALGDAPTHQAADLRGEGGRSTARQIPPPPFYTREQKTTDNSILDAEAQLVAQVRTSDEDGGHGGASDDVELDPGLVLQALHQQEQRTASVQHKHDSEKLQP